MRTLEQTIEEVLDLAARYCHVPREQLHPDDDLFETLRIDSLRALELLGRLEQHFQIELPDYELQGVTSFRALAERVHARL
jgi:acyl carrier protein